MRNHVKKLAGIAAVVAIVVTFNTLALVPALATGAEGITTFSGASAGTIVLSTNTSTGSAIEGVTGTVAGGQAVYGVGSNSLNASTGIHGRVTGPTSIAVNAEAINTDKTHPSLGVKAHSNSGYAVYAFDSVAGLTALYATNLDTTSTTSHAILAAAKGTAITATSTGAHGLSGTTSATTGVSAGVRGNDNQITATTNWGMYGTSTKGIGVEGDSSSSLGVFGKSTTGGGAAGFTASCATCPFAAGVLGKDNGIGNDGVQGTSGSGFGVEGDSASSIGVFAQSSSNAAPALYVNGGAPSGFASSSSPVLIVHYRGAAVSCGGVTSTTNNVASIDQHGNLRLCGTVSSSVQPLVITRTTTGAHVVTYAARQSQPTIEDFGSGELVDGRSFVRLDPAFAATIDPRSRYLVFLTPRGDNHGLYVAQQSLSGFGVRESQGGRSTLEFDYRVVAKPADTNAQRLPPDANVVPTLRSVLPLRKI